MIHGSVSNAADAMADRLRQVGIVPVVELPDQDAAVPLARALMAGGISCVEITFRTPAARDGVAAIRKACPDILLGAGTILDDDQLTAAVEAGADFVVAPGTNPAMVQSCFARGIPMLPGVCTPSDIERARGLGVRLMKFFPAEPIGGVGYLRALCGPYRDVSFVPTGGITPKELPEYLALPQVLACGGSWMVKPQTLLARDFERVQCLAAEARTIVASAR